MSPIADGDLKPASQVRLTGRAFAGSTETYLSVDTQLTEFWLALGKLGTDEPIGYERYERRDGWDRKTAGRLIPTFELTEVRPGHCPPPHPIVSMSGVLWTRHVALEADQRIQSFQRQEGWMPGCGPLGFV